MKLILIVFLFFQFNIILAQEYSLKLCNLKYEIDTLNLQKTGLIKLKITNLETRTLRVPKDFDRMRIQAQNIERYDDELQKFISAKNSFFDVNCTKCNEKTTSLKSNKSIEYSFEINKLYLVEKVLKELDTKYRFNLLFINTDFRYPKNIKCFIDNYETSQITYKTR